HIGGLSLDEFGHPCGTDQDPGQSETTPVVAASLRFGEQGQLQILRRPAPGDGDRGRTRLKYLRGRALGGRPACGRPGYPETRGVALDHIKGLNTDRAGTAQHEYRTLL